MIWLNSFQVFVKATLYPYPANCEDIPFRVLSEKHPIKRSETFIMYKGVKQISVISPLFYFFNIGNVSVFVCLTLFMYIWYYLDDIDLMLGLENIIIKCVYSIQVNKYYCGSTLIHVIFCFDIFK